MRYLAAVLTLFLAATNAHAVDDVWQINLQGPDYHGLVIVFEGRDLDIIPEGVCGVELTSPFTHYWHEVGQEPGDGDQVLPGQNGTPSDSSPQIIRVTGIPHIGPECGDIGSDTANVQIEGTEVDWVGAGLGQLVVQDADWQWLDPDGDPRPKPPSCEEMNCAAIDGLTLGFRPPIGRLSLLRALVSAEVLQDEVEGLSASGDEARPSARLEAAADGLSQNLEDAIVHQAAAAARAGEATPELGRLATALQLAQACRVNREKLDEACWTATQTAQAALRTLGVPLLDN